LREFEGQYLLQFFHPFLLKNQEDFTFLFLPEFLNEANFHCISIKLSSVNIYSAPPRNKISTINYKYPISYTADLKLSLKKNFSNRMSIYFLNSIQPQKILQDNNLLLKISGVKAFNSLFFFFFQIKKKKKKIYFLPLILNL
jgi:hypothetical protein